VISYEQFVLSLGKLDAAMGETLQGFENIFQILDLEP